MFNAEAPTPNGPDHILVFKRFAKSQPYYEYYAGPSEPKELRDWARSYMTRTVHGDEVLLARISRYFHSSDKHTKNPYAIIEIKEAIKIMDPMD